VEDQVTRVAVYAGSFDPVTLGHLDVVRRGTTLFDEVVVAVGHNVRKKRTMPLDTRLAVLREVTAELPRVRVETFEGLLVDYCRKIGAAAILRGLRAVTDFEFEFQTGLANMSMAPDVQTVFLLTDPRYIFVSSSLIKEIAINGGDVSAYLPPAAFAALSAALKEP
jgi:pantetheine-phosphate adenylyltransferase